MTTRVLLATASAFALASCSSGDSSGGGTPPSGSTPPPSTTNGNTLSVTGPITGFGSIVVRGVHYEVENGTVVEIEGEPVANGDDSALRLGMVVSVTAREVNGERRATRIKYDDDLKGPARDVTPNADDPQFGSFTVHGQLVVVTEETILDDNIGDNDAVAGIDIRDLDPANFPGGSNIVVEVSGFPTDDGFIASRVERIDASGTRGDPNVDDDEFEVKGYVDAVASDGSSFEINGATFLVTNETVFQDELLPDSSLVGVYVEVKFDEDATGDYIAVEVEREDKNDNDDDADEFEVEGLLQEIDATADPDVFVINGMTVETVDVSPLSNFVGQQVEVKGTYNDAGLLVISSVEVEIEKTVKLEDRITAIDVTNGTLTTRLGLVITPTEAARVQDSKGENGARLTPEAFIARLMVDDHIRAFGYPDPENAGAIFWTRIERRERDDRECRFRGPVDDGSISDPQFAILGITIDTNGLGFGGFEWDGVGDIGREEFFANVAAGDIVHAKSDDGGVGCADGSLSTGATGGVEIENEDDD